MADNRVLVVINRHSLGDGSQVHNVSIGGVLLHTVSEADASALVGKLRDAIGQHTLERVLVAYT